MSLCIKEGSPQLRLRINLLNELGIDREEYLRLREIALMCRAEPVKWREYTTDETILTSLRSSGIAGQIHWLHLNPSSLNTPTSASICPPQPSTLDTTSSGEMGPTTRTRRAWVFNRMDGMI